MVMPVLLYGSECLTLTKEHMKRMETGDRATAGYGMNPGRKHNGDNRENGGITDTNTAMK
jgi:hypothetical protein